MSLLLKEREQGSVLDMDTKVVTGITSHPAGYVGTQHPERETIVGLQTDKPLKRALHVNGGIRIACQAAAQHGYEVDSRRLMDFHQQAQDAQRRRIRRLYPRDARLSFRPYHHQACLTATAVAASSAITVAWPSTASMR